MGTLGLVLPVLKKLK